MDLPGAEYQRPVLFLSRTHPVSNPVGNPGEQLLLGFVHPKKHVVAIEPFANIESRDIRNPKTGIDRQPSRNP
jgi:hypothetical protein